MSQNDLGNLLTQLRSHLPDDQISEQQSQLLARIQYHIHEEGEQDPEEPSLKQSVEMLVNELESDHPVGVSVAKKILESLNAMGI